jgi:hypothetical protein
MGHVLGHAYAGQLKSTTFVVYPRKTIRQCRSTQIPTQPLTLRAGGNRL